MKGASHRHPGRIGPNAILRIIEALGPDSALAREVLERAQLVGYLTNPPTAMVEEQEVRALHQALRETLGGEGARAVGRQGGHRTADYLLANRIPPLAQTLLKALPAPLAGRLLLKAIARNAWTFAGNGLFSYEPGRPYRLRIAGCAICGDARSNGPLCDYYAATFERLFQVLVSARSRVIEIHCQAQGHPACTFDIHTGSPG